MNSTLPPATWRSEAFAEDLADDTPEAAGTARRASSGSTGALLILWGVVPLVVAAAGAVVVAWARV